MQHLRKDYDAIQPWPVKRPHIAKVTGDGMTGPTTVMEIASSEEKSGIWDTIEPIIPDDEPVFLLRATDPVAAMVVHYWASMARDCGADVHLVNRVHEWADHMNEYRDRQDKVKLYPDTPDGMLR